LTDYQVVEKHPNGSQVLLDRRCLVAQAQLFNICRDDDRLDHVQVDLPLFAPVREPTDGASVREPRILVSDVGREELDETFRGTFTGVRDEPGGATRNRCARARLLKQ